MWILLAVIAIIGITLYATGTNKIQSKTEVIIDKNIDAVWDVMGNQYEHVHLWSSNFSDSKPEGIPKLPNVDYLHRATITERGETLQELDAFDPENYRLEYHICKGAPSIAKKAYAKWYLTPTEDGKTKAVFEFFIDTDGFKGRLLSKLIGLKIGKAGHVMAIELKHYLEEGVTLSPK